jgi:hypothetical protein
MQALIDLPHETRRGVPARLEAGSEERWSAAMTITFVVATSTTLWATIIMALRILLS